MKVIEPATLQLKTRQEDSVLAVQGAQATLRWWQEQAAAIEEDRRKVLLILPIAMFITAVMLPFFPRSALAVAALAALATMQGMYLVTVHRWEFAHNVVEAKKELWIAQKKAVDQHQARDIVLARKSGVRFAGKPTLKGAGRAFIPKEI